MNDKELNMQGCQEEQPKLYVHQEILFAPTPKRDLGTSELVQKGTEAIIRQSKLRREFVVSI